MIFTWNFSSVKSSLKNGCLFLKEQPKKEGIFLFLGLIVLFGFSSYLALKSYTMPEKVYLSQKALDRKKSIMEKKQKIEEEMKKHPLAILDKALVEVINTHKKQELELVSQFQGFEGLKGHEAKLIFERVSFERFFETKEVIITPPYKEVYYTIKQPFFLTDQELKMLIQQIEEMKIKNSSVLVNLFSFKKKKIEDQEKYEVNFSFIIREKM